MPRKEVSITLPPHIDTLIDLLAARSHLTRSEVVRQAVLTLNVLINNQADNGLYIESVREQFGKEESSG